MITTRGGHQYSKSGHHLKSRSDVLLLLIESRCHSDGRYWVASADSQYVELLDEWVSVYGSGDARALKSLWAKGLIEKMPLGGCSYRITEDGKLRAQSLA